MKPNPRHCSECGAVLPADARATPAHAGRLVCVVCVVFCVGDEDQCIYAWRRASVQRVIDLAAVKGKNVVVETSMAKYWVTDMANRVADRCLQLHGGYGYCDEYEISRAWRDIRITRIFAGTNEIMKTIIARFMGL